MVPEGWKTAKLAKLALNERNAFIDGDWIEAPHIREDGIRLLQTGNIGIGRFIEKSQKKYISKGSFEKLKCKTVKPGDLLFCRLADPVGRSCFAPNLTESMITSVDVTIMRHNDHVVDRSFLMQYSSSQAWLRKAASQAGGSTRSRISRKNLGKMLVILPPLPEQKKIAEILTSVDEAIAATKAVIEQTKKVKQGLLQELLTKGIGHTEFKDTPIGKIPASWELKRLDELARVERGRFSHRPRNARHLYGGPYPFLQTGDVAASDRITSFKQTLTEEGMATSKFFSVGTILVSIVGANLGSAAITTFEAACPDSVIAITPKSVVREWLFQVALTWKMELQGRATQSARQNINLATLRPFLIAVPNENEQKKISEAAVAFDEVYTSGNERLRRLRTIKAGLLQDLLTGKVRVNL